MLASYTPTYRAYLEPPPEGNAWQAEASVFPTLSETASLNTRHPEVMGNPPPQEPSSTPPPSTAAPPSQRKRPALTHSCKMTSSLTLRSRFTKQICEFFSPLSYPLSLRNRHGTNALGEKEEGGEAAVGE